MRVRFDTEKTNRLIEGSGYKKKYLIKKLDTSVATFGRWMNEETLIPFVKAVELAKILNCDVNDLYEIEKE